jgi:YHYH protein/Cadherin domain
MRHAQLRNWTATGRRTGQQVLRLDTLEDRRLFSVSPALLNSWFVSGQGEFAQVISAVNGGTTIGPSTTWSGQNSPVLGDIQKVSAATGSDYVYVNTPDLASYVMGPWWMDAGHTQPFVNFPKDQASIFRIALNTTYPSSTHASAGNGPIGIAVNGVALFNNGDAFTYKHSTAADTGMGGDGIWNRQAEWGEAITFDAGNGHQPGNGQYHYHTDPPAIRAQLGDNIDYVGTTNFFPYDPAVYLLTQGEGSDGDFVDHTTNLHHSPIIGWMFDGHPIYGPYGYSNPTDPASAVTRMRSSYSIRTDLTNGSPRIAVPGWSAQLDAAQLGAAAAATAADAFYTMTAAQQSQYAGPAVSTTYPLGRYGEDYAYVTGSGDLDQWNGRWCVTPEFPNGVYAYFDTIDANGDSAFPYLMGRQYYGASNGSGKVTSITEPVTVAFDVSTNTAPVVHGPSATTVPHGGTLNLSGANLLSATDVDAGASESVMLAVSAGTLAVDLSSGLAAGATITAGASGSATLTLGGNLALINAALATLTFTAPGTGATATLTAQADDGSAANNLSNTLTTTITLSNRAPVVSGPSAVNAPHGSSFAFAGAGNTFSVADADSTSATVTLAASAGTLTVTAGATVVTGNGSATLTVAGTLADVNTALTTLAYLCPGTGTSTTLTVQADDGSAANNLSNLLTTTITLVDGPPTDIDLTPSAIAENQPTGTIVGVLTATDPDSTNFTYTLVSGPGADDNASFLIAGDKLQSNALFDFESRSSFSIRVQAMDDGGQSFEKPLTVTITNVNEPPAFTGGPFAFFYDSAEPANAVIGTVAATDVDAGDHLSYSLAVGDPAVFAVDAATGDVTMIDPSAAAGDYQLTVRVTDSGNLFADATVTVVEHHAPVIDTDPKVVVEVIPPKATTFRGAPVSVLAAHVTFVDGGGPAGVAITSALASLTTGRWQFSTDGGASWVDVPTVTATHALLLANDPANRVRFVPTAKFTGFADLEYAAWDLSAGTPSTTAAPSFGDTTVGLAFSPAIEKASVAVGKTTPTIDLRGEPLLPALARDAQAPAGTPAKSLLGMLATDADRKTTLGLAVTAIDNTHGTWQYQAGRKWLDIGPVSAADALLLGPTTKVRFVPAPGYFGAATISYRAWDQSIGRAGQRGPATGSAFSALSDTAVVDVQTRPVLDTTVAQALPTPASSALVSDLLAATVTDVLPGTVLGIAVTKVSGNGTWTYQIGLAAPVALKASAGSAVLLPADAVLQFAPVAGFTGRAILSYRVWNATTLPAVAGRRLNPSGIAFSTAVENLTLDVPQAAGNTKPILATTAVNLGTIAEDPKTSPTLSIKSLVHLAAITDVNAHDPLGIALTAADQANGTWQYSLDRKTWNTIPTVALTSALVLSDPASVRFVPAANFNSSATIGFRAWDGTVGSAGDLLDSTSGTAFSTAAGVGTLTITPVNDAPTLDPSVAHHLPAIGTGQTSAAVAVSALTALATDVETAPTALGIAVTAVDGPGAWQSSPDGVAFADLTKFPTLLPPSARLRFVGDPAKAGLAALTFRTWDGSSGTGTPLKPDALSGAADRLTVAVGKAAPILTGAGTLTTLTEDPVKNVGDKVSGILGTTFTNTAVGMLGLALTGTTAPVAGAWQFSLDAGKTWQAVPAVDAQSALLLPDSARVRFAPARDVFTPTDLDRPTIAYTAWDQTVGVAGQSIDTTEPTLNSFGGSQTAALRITSVADAPTLETSRLQNPTGITTVAGLLAGTAVDPETTNLGIAVTGLTGHGVWEYSLDGFATAGIAIVGAAPAAALLLPATASLRFVPQAGTTGPAGLRFKAWNADSGLSGKVNTVAGPNKSFFSLGIAALSIAVGNTAPILDPL